MAELKEAVAEQNADEEIFNLEAIAAVKHSAAMELKAEGNEFFKKGKKHYSDALDRYTRAIKQNALTDAETSVLHSNSAQVNLLLGNYRRALQDAEEAIKLSPTNVKAHYRAVKASLSLNLLDEAKAFCDKGLEMSPEYEEELKKLAKQIGSMKLVHEQHEVEVTNVVAAAKRLVSAFEDRGLKIGKAVYQKLYGIKNPTLDESNILHWPVVLLYDEFMTLDLIEDFCETDMFSAHLDIMFSDSSSPLQWDTQKNYTRDAVELFYEANPGVGLPKKAILHQLLEGTVASHLENFGDEETGDARNLSAIGIPDNSKWFRVDQRTTLHDLLKTFAHTIIPGIPVFHVTTKKSSTFDNFKPKNFPGAKSG